MSRRREFGEGTIRRRDDGRFELRASFGVGVDGKRDRRSYYGLTEMEVLKKYKLERDAYESGIAVPDRRMTFATFVAQWLDVQVLAWRPSTRNSRTSWINTHLLPNLGSVELSRITPGHVARTIKAAQSKLAPQTAHDVAVLLRQILGSAVLDWRLIEHNPAERVPLPAVPERDPKFLTPSQIETFLSWVDASSYRRYWCLFATVIGTGLRFGEVTALRWSDVDLEDRVLTVNRARSIAEGGGKAFAEPKTKRSRRTLRLPRFVAVALERQRREQAELRAAAGDNWVEQGLVFANQFGRPLSHTRVGEASKAAFKAIGLDGFSFHSLRHTSATILRAMLVPDRTVMEILGHTDERMTARYAHLTPGLLDLAADAIDEALGGNPS